MLLNGEPTALQPGDLICIELETGLVSVSRSGFTLGSIDGQDKLPVDQYRSITDGVARCTAYIIAEVAGLRLGKAQKRQSGMLVIFPLVQA